MNINYFYVLATIGFTVYGQLVLKWQVNAQVSIPENFMDKLYFMLKLILTQPFVFSGFCSAFVASLFWMSAIKNLPLSLAYPMMSLSYVIVTLLSAMVFHETITLGKFSGLLLIIMGTIVIGMTAQNT